MAKITPHDSMPSFLISLLTSRSVLNLSTILLKSFLDPEIGHGINSLPLSPVSSLAILPALNIQK